MRKLRNNLRYTCLPALLFLFTITAQAQQLQANFTIDKTGGCSPLTVAFTNRTTGASGNAVYKWDLGNGNTSALQNPGAIYMEEKAYTVTLTVTDGSQVSTRSTTITVYKKPTVDFAPSTPKVCLPSAATFNSTSTAGDGFISSYYWDFGDGTSQQGYGNQVSHNYSIEQKATVSLTVTNSFGCYNSITKVDAIEVLPRLNPSFTVAKNTLCDISEAAQFTNTSTGPGTLSYTWQFGDGNSSTQKDPSHVYNTKQVYNVSLRVTNTDGCTATSNTASVNAAYFNTDFTNRILCREASFNSSSYLYPSSSLWQFGDASSVTSYAPSHIYATAGTYTVKLINTYNNCKDSISKTIKVEDLVNFGSDIEVPSLLCKDGYYTFKSKSNTAPSHTLWEMGDGYTNSWSNQINYQYSKAGTYALKLTNTFGTCKETVTKNIVVNDKPDLKGFVIDLGGACGSPVTAQFKDTTAGAVKWQWYMDHGYYSNTPFSTAQNPTYNFANDNYYSVYLTVTNAAGCTQNTSKYFTVRRPSIYINHTYSSSPRGSNYDCDSLRITMNAYGDQPIQSYVWNFGDGTTSTEATPTHSYLKEGIYTITLNYTTQLGCKGTTTYSARVYGKPKAAFGYSIPCGNSLNLQFYDQSFFSDNWYWQFAPNNSTQYYATPTMQYSDTGKYNVKFISHIGHCSDTIEKVIHANVLPSFVNITKAINNCEGNYGTFTFDQRSLRISSGTWNFGDGTVIPYDTSVHVIKHTYTRTGTFSVVLTGVSGNCTLTDSRLLHVLLKQSPTLTANKAEICANENLDIQITNLQTNPQYSSSWSQYYVTKLEYGDGTAHSGWYNYNWDNTNFRATLQNLAAGTTKLRFIVMPYGYSCPDTTNYINIKVNGPIAGFKILNNNSCFKSPFVFEDTSKTSTNTPLRTWRWDFGDGTIITKTTNEKVSHLYKDPRDYTVRLTVTDASGCTVTTTDVAKARGPKASFIPSGLFVPNVPLNTTVTFNNYSTTWYSNSVNYTWNYGEGPESAAYTGSYTYTKAGTYTVSLITKDPSLPCSDTMEKVIHVKDFNTAFSFTTSNITSSACPPVVVRINNLSVGFTKLKWDFGDGTASETQYYPSHTYTKPGTYKITLYTYGYNGLTGTYVDSVIVKMPSAQLAADVLQGCLSQTVSLQGNAQNTNTYLWDFGDGTLQTTANTATHNFVTPGLYKPRLLVKDDKGCTVASELKENIVIDDLKIAIKGIPALICNEAVIHFQPDVISFAADQLQKTLTYKWDFGTGDAADVSTERAPSFRYAKPGTYKVTFSVRSPYGCFQETTANVVVTEKARGAITAIAETCEGGNVQFSATAAPAGTLQWDWQFGNGQVSNQQNPATQLYSTPGNYDIRLIVNRNGCNDTSFHKLTVHAKPNVNLSPKQALVCLGNSLPLSAQGGGTYVWTPATGLSNPNIANPIAQPVADITYQVQVTTDKGCTNTESVKVTVAQPIQLQVIKEANICKDGQIQLTASGATSYRWINTTAGLSNTQIPNPIARPATTTTYTLVGYDANQCFTDTARVTIGVQQPPTVNAGPDAEITGGDSYQLQPTGSSDITSWSWTPAQDLSCATCPAPISKAKYTTNYVVSVKNSYGCTASDTVVIKVKCAPDYIHIPNVFTPNYDGKNDVFYIAGSGAFIRYFRIYNRWGELVFERTNYSIDDRSKGWDGRYKGKVAPVGSYVYMAEMECSGGDVFTRQGTVTIIK